MTVETKFYCDECGRETTHGVSLAVMAVEGLHEMPSAFDLEKFNKIPWHGKDVYNKFLCPDCLGEAIRHPTIGEHDHYFELKEKARDFLIKHGFLKPKPDSGPPATVEDPFYTFYLMDFKKQDGKVFWRWTGKPPDEWKEETDILAFLTAYYPLKWRAFIMKTMELS